MRRLYIWWKRRSGKDNLYKIPLQLLNSSSVSPPPRLPGPSLLQAALLSPVGSSVRYLIRRSTIRSRSIKSGRSSASEASRSRRTSFTHQSRRRLLPESQVQPLNNPIIASRTYLTRITTSVSPETLVPSITHTEPFGFSRFPITPPTGSQVVPLYHPVIARNIYLTNITT